jgi:Protein of unknown function (DUF3592)/Protein of unknown function (DUF2510)
MSAPEAGWYEDESGQARWWDGTKWTDHLMKNEPAATEPVNPPQPPPYVAPQSATSGVEDAINDVSDFAQRHNMGLRVYPDGNPTITFGNTPNNGTWLDGVTPTGTVPQGNAGYSGYTPSPVVGGRSSIQLGPRAGAIMGIALGAIFMLVSLVLIPTPNKAYTSSTQGTIVDVHRTAGSHSSRNRSSSSPTCTPTASYTVNGQAYTVKSKVGGSCGTYYRGAPVMVKYDPNDPSKSEVDISGMAWTRWIFFGAGLAMVLASGFGLFKYTMAGRK